MASTEKFLNSSGLSSLWAKIKSKFYTKTEVDALIPEDEIFLVNITTSGTGENITYVSDKTADEVDALANSYKIIYGVENSGNDYYIWHNGYFHNIGERTGLSGFYVKDLVFSPQISSYALSPIYTRLAEQDTLSNYLAKGNTTAYTPTTDYNPATKKYVDDKVVYSTISINGTTATFSSPITPKYVYENYSNKRIYAKYGYEGRMYALSKCEEDDGDVQIIFSCVENGVLHTITSAWVSESSTSALTGTVASTSIPVASSTAPIMDGTAAIGSSSAYAKADHVHPSDTSKANVADVLSKTNTTSYTPTADYHPATKKYVDDNAGASVYYVTVTKPSSSYLADRTFDEVEAAYNNGDIVYIIYDDKLYRLSYVGSVSMEFEYVDYEASPNMGTYATLSYFLWNKQTSTISFQKLTTKKSISDLTDTTISSPTDGQVLAYDSATSKWINTTLNTGATYSLSMSNNVITLTGSDSSTSSATLPVFGGTSADVWEGGAY